MKTIKKDNDTESKLANLLLWAGLVKDSSDEDMEIEFLIRERYSMSQETAIHRKKLMGIISEAEWDAYVAFVEECKAKVREKSAEE